MENINPILYLCLAARVIFLLDIVIFIVIINDIVVIIQYLTIKKEELCLYTRCKLNTILNLKVMNMCYQIICLFRLKNVVAGGELKTSKLSWQNPGFKGLYLIIK